MITILIVDRESDSMDSMDSMDCMHGHSMFKLHFKSCIKPTLHCGANICLFLVELLSLCQVPTLLAAPIRPVPRNLGGQDVGVLGTTLLIIQSLKMLYF